MNFKTLQTIAITTAAAVTLSACAANATTASPAPAPAPVSGAKVAAVSSGSSTVAQAKTLQDDAKISLTGKLVRHVGDEKFELQDRTGSIIVEIDDDYYRSPQELVGKTVTVHGEVDRDSRKLEIDANHVQLH